MPAHIVMNDADHTTVRNAWVEYGTGSAKNMDNEGGRPFLFPGKVPGYENVFPDVDRINPGLLPVHRSQDRLPERQRICSFHRSFTPRCQPVVEEVLLVAGFLRAFHPIHLVALPGQQHGAQPHSSRYHPGERDRSRLSSGHRLGLKKYGPPPFGTLLSANANPSTLVNWGENSWVTLHQTGNKREHKNYWYLTEIFRDAHPRPALERRAVLRRLHLCALFRQQRPGRRQRRHSDATTSLCAHRCTAAFFRAGLRATSTEPKAYGVPTSNLPLRQRCGTPSSGPPAPQMQHLRTFAFSIGARYQDLVPDRGLRGSQLDAGREGLSKAGPMPRAHPIRASSCSILKRDARRALFAVRA